MSCTYCGRLLHNSFLLSFIVQFINFFYSFNFEIILLFKRYQVYSENRNLISAALNKNLCLLRTMFFTGHLESSYRDCGDGLISLMMCVNLNGALEAFSWLKRHRFLEYTENNFVPFISFQVNDTCGNEISCTQRGRKQSCVTLQHIRNMNTTKAKREGKKKK